MVAGWEGLWGMGKKMKKYKLFVTEQSWGCEAQHREHSQQYPTNYEWCQMGERFTRLSLI